VAARGIDIKGVDLVLQFTIPTNTDSYVHRAGRTGRAGNLGTSIVFYSERENRELKNLEKNIGNGFKFERQPSPSPSSVMAAAASHAVNSLNNVNPSVISFFRDEASELIESTQAKDGNLTDLVAKCLAMISGKNELTTWSLQTGESGLTTVTLKAPRELK
jgi:ATP-dependent RNA helicase DDX21